MSRASSGFLNCDTNHDHMAENKHPAPNRLATGRQLGAYKSAAKKHGISLDEWFRRIESGLRCCFRCKRWLPVDRFSSDKSRSMQRTHSCKACSVVASKASKYGLGFDELAGMIDAQDGRCGLCHKVAVRLCVDHCHETGAVRSLLCDGCNVGLGLFGDDPDRLIEAADYIKKHRNGSNNN